VVAALGGWVWLGWLFAAAWLGVVLALAAADRVLCAFVQSRPEPGRRLEGLVATSTFIYTCAYCVMPFGLATQTEHQTALLGAAAMIGAIALSSTSEFVISRRIGMGSLSALAAGAALIVAARADAEPVLNIVFATLAVLGFFGCILLFALHRRQEDRSLQEAVAAAEAANAAKSVFLATMSHEIRTPLNGILGMAQAMAADGLSDRQSERLGIIRDAGASLTTILNDVLDFSKIEAGKMELEIRPFDLGGCLRATAAAFEPLADEKGLAFSVEIAPDAEGMYLGDAARVRQVVANLLSNAVKFTDRGSVTLRVEAGWEALRVAVIDTGPGLPADQIDRLFGKFSQLDASTTRRHGGTGLGLAISRDLCRLMRGDLTAASEPGQGATFSACMPLTRVGDVVPDTIALAEEPAGRGALRVLAAEDNRVNRIVLEALLAQIEVAPMIVEDGAQAIAAWRAQDWDLILMDVHMPVLDGVGAVRQIRAEEAAAGRRRTPVIALTANAMTHQVGELLACGMDLHVAKPIDAAALFRAMETALELAEAGA
jgi:signal transduction histidine kinase/ActR/RegA family two-component response regulator